MAADLTTNRWLDNLYIRGIVEDLTSKIDRERPLRFIDRTPVVDAYDDEIFGRWSTNDFAADVIADGQKAVTVSAGKLEIISLTLPNIKTGTTLDQTLLNRMDELMERGPSQLQDERMGFTIAGIIAARLRGVKRRLNALVCQMQLDNLVYDRYGVQITAGYSAPADLKVLVSVPWTNAGSATPITDLETVRNSASDTYNKVYNRLTLGRPDFDLMTKTTEFQTRATALAGAFFVAAINQGDRPSMLRYAGQLLGMEIELEDGTYKMQNPGGAEPKNRVLPLGTVILSDSQDDNDPEIMDVANAKVTEAMVARITGMGPAGLGGQVFGPVAYSAPSNVNLNEPAVNIWAVQRAFPRRKQKEAVATLTVR